MFTIKLMPPTFCTYLQYLGSNFVQTFTKPSTFWTYYPQYKSLISTAQGEVPYPDFIWFHVSNLKAMKMKNKKITLWIKKPSKLM